MTLTPDKSGRQNIPPSHPTELETSSLKAVLEHSDDAIFCKTLNNIITLWSRGAERVYGYSSEEMVGKSVDLLLPPDRQDETKALIARVAAGEHVEHFETLRITRAGVCIPVLLNLTPLRDAAGFITGAVTIARDTSATKEAELAAREAQQQFQVTFEQAAIGIAHVGADGRWLRVNERLCAILGYGRDEMCEIVTNTRDELIATTFQEITHPEDLEAELRDVRRVLAGEMNAYSMEKRYLRPDGQAVWVYQTVSLVRDASGDTKYFLAFVEDISKRKLADERLRSLENQGRDRAVVLETAHRVALGVLSQLTGVEALRHIAGAARTLAGARYAAIGVARLDGMGLSEFVTVGLTPEEEILLGKRPEGIGVLGHLLHRRDPLRIDSLSSHPASVGFPPNHPPMESFLGVPICRGDAVLGSLYLTNKEGGGPFTEADELAVQALGAYAAVAINSLEMIARQRDLVRGLIVAQEDERRAVAYDLHDGLTQYVMASQAHLESFRKAKLDGKTERAERELTQGLSFLKEAVSESRRLVNGLRSLALDDLGLAGALEQHLAEEKTRAGWNEAEFVHNIAGRRFDQTLETAVYRVAQEALTNARKHADARRVRLILLQENDAAYGVARLNLEVRDWGRGFIPEKVAGDVGRVGLHSMAERVGLMNGTYQLTAAIGEGTTVSAHFPLTEARADDARK
jgi:PAS domain S-box-containing protein